MKERVYIQGKTFDEERALYGTENAIIKNCSFAGEGDGESALKECRDITINECDFRLRYPLWHVEDAVITNSNMSCDCRAALWYDRNIIIQDSQINGIKALRECENVIIENTVIHSEEFGWLCRDVEIKGSKLVSEYQFFQSRNLNFDDFVMQGKYSFQYAEDVTITKSRLDTKDAFWHAKNVTVTDSIVKGEYLGWYSENLKLISCMIIGTQPLCYAKGLILEDCEMIDCDLAFEKSDVQANIVGSIDSIKNPDNGYITADTIDDIIIKNESSCVITTKEPCNTDMCCC